jgi:hypothetical protein
MVRNPFGRKPQNRWVGESGYCNCLLVAMARMQISRVELSTEEALPNLEAMVGARPDSLEWIRAQGFEYDKLNRVTIIRMLADSAGISPYKKRFDGFVEVKDCVGDDGPVVDRKLSMQLGIRGEAVVLAVTQEGVDAA